MGLDVLKAGSAPPHFGRELTGFARVQMRDLESVIVEACGRHHVTVDEFFSKARYQPLPDARTDAIVAFRALGFALPEIGRLMGHVDHTTALHHLRKAEARASRVRIAS